VAPAHPELLGDFHVHSTFSDDAVSTIAQNLAAASARGLREIRLIDHVRASTTWVPDFVAAVARESAPSGLRVHTGVEAKVMDVHGTIDIPAGLRIGRGGVDAVVIADHQFPGTDGPWSPTETRARLDAGLAPADALDMLVSALVAAMRSVESAQLAHCFSILPKVGLSESDLSDQHLTAWGSAAAATGTAIEVNEKWACPAPRSLRAAIAAGATVVASTDAHVDSEVGLYDRVEGILSDTRAE
jgi:putative hydrolase